jgi:hypothetical protein
MSARRFIALVAALSAATSLQAQPAATAKADSSGIEGFTTGPIYVGGRIWAGGLEGDGSLAFGGMVEKGFTKPGAYGPGIISGGVSVDYYSWGNSFFNYSYVPVTVFSNYNFVLKNRKLSPYVGLGFGYTTVSASVEGTRVGIGSALGSYSYFAAQLGGRYFVNDRMALQAHAGVGVGAISLGATFKL